MAVHLAKPESMIAPTVIRVVLVDDHPVMREGLRGVLERSGDIEVAGEGSSGGDAVDLCERLRPDVVLIDLVMPDMDGYSAALLIAAACPGTRVVALSGYSEDEMVL